MEFSLSLMRHRLASRRGPLTQPRFGPRPSGRLLWAHFGRDIDPTGARIVLAAVTADAPDLHVVTTGATGEYPAPVDTAVSGTAILDAWSPDLAVFFGSDPFPAIWAEAQRRRLPLIAAETDTARLPLPLIRPMIRFDAVIAIVPDQRLGPVVEALGPLSVVPDPPSATRGLASLRQSIAARPVWLALDVPFAEINHVLAAHDHVTRISHRLLMILAPDEPGRVHDVLSRRGWRFATHSAGEAPMPDDRILVVDDSDQIGDWLRIAPVTFLGGTFEGTGPRNSPFAPAALGSAVIHGPVIEAFGPEFARLRSAGATRCVDEAGALALELERLQGPDTAADLARAGWAVTSANAEVSARLVELIGDVLAGVDV